MKRITLLVIALLAATNSWSQASSLTQEINLKLDEVGFAQVSVKAKLNAQQWQQWMGVYGNAQHVMKRDLKHEYSTIHMEDFAMSRADSDRVFTVSFSAHGAAVYLGNDRWEMDLEEGARARKLSEKQWLVQVNSTDGGGLLQQETTIDLPASAISSEQSVGELGQDVIRYVLPTEASGFSGMLWPGVAAAVLGLALLVFGFARKADSGPVTIVAEPTPQIPTPQAGVEHPADEQAKQEV